MLEFKEWHDCLNHNQDDWLNDIPMFEGSLREEWKDVQERWSALTTPVSAVWDAGVAKSRLQHRIGIWTGLPLNLTMNREMENFWPPFRPHECLDEFEELLDAADCTRDRFVELYGKDEMVARERQEILGFLDQDKFENCRRKLSVALVKLARVLADENRLRVSALSKVYARGAEEAAT